MTKSELTAFLEAELAAFPGRASLLMVDLKRRKDLFACNADAPAPAASLIKVPLLLTAVDLGRGVMRRIRSHFAVILGFNSLFLLLGLTGLLRPGLAAALHNGTTVDVAVNAMRPLRLPGAAALHASDIGARRAGERS